MDLGRLSREGFVRETGRNPELAEKALSAAESDLRDAKRNLDAGSLDWALAIAYSAMLQAGLALMFAKGFRPASEGSHLAVVKFASEALPAGSAELVKRFNQMRKRRHAVVYEERGTVTREEAANAISRAAEFVKEIRSRAKSR